MRRFGMLSLWTALGLAALAGVVAAVSRADDRKTDDKTVVPLPGPAARGVVVGDVFYTVADSKLEAVDLKKRDATTFSECYNFYPKLRPFVDAADGKACVATDDALLVIDLKGGDILHRAKYQGEVHGLGFADEKRLFVLGRTDVVVIDAASGETAATIPILKDEGSRPVRVGGLSAYQKVGKLLYVADSDQKRVRVIDLEAGKAVEEMRSGFDWYTAMQIVGDRAFVRSINLGYGVNIPQFGFFDLKTKKYMALKYPTDKALEHVEPETFAEATLVAGPDAGLCFAWKGQIYQYDGEGRQVGATPLAKDDDGRLVGVWNGHALTAGKDGLRLTPLAKATAAKSD